MGIRRLLSLFYLVGDGTELNSVIPTHSDLVPELKQLSGDFGKMIYPMGPREREIYVETQSITDRVYGNEIHISEGVVLLRTVLEKVLGQEHLQVILKSLF